MILVGDIGGTNTRLALFEGGKQLVERKFQSRNFQSLEDIAKAFLAEEKKQGQVAKACFGIAGPVREGKCKTTNLPWTIDAEHLSRTLQIPAVYLLNDLEANAYGLKVLKQDELFCLHPGKKQTGNQALIAAGTGLGEAGLFWDGKEHRPLACEGGHTDFAPRDASEWSLFQALQKLFGHVSYERVVSGMGLQNIYRFLIDSKQFLPSPQVEEAMKKKDPAEVISEWGSQNKDSACTRTVDWFLSLYGAEAGNLALKFLALGGVFVGGGIAPHLLERIKKGGFLSSFLDKGRFKGLLDTIPIWVVLNDNAALLGAAYFAAKK